MSYRLKKSTSNPNPNSDAGGFSVWGKRQYHPNDREGEKERNIIRGFPYNSVSDEERTSTTLPY